MQLHCPQCETTTDIEEDRIADVIQTHNESRHNGNPIAGVGPNAVPFSDYTNNDVDPFYSHSMGEDAGPMGNHPDGVRGICKDCEVVALFDNEYVTSDAVDDHNDMVHDGTDVAGICEWDIESLPSASELIEGGGLNALVAISEGL